jgi:hypothetical protein
MESGCHLHAPAVMPPGKQPEYPLDERLGGLQCRSGRFGGEKYPNPGRESNPDTRVHSLVTMQTDL